MNLIMSVRTSCTDLEIKCVDVRLNTGRIVSLNWETSEVRRNDTGFVAEYRNIDFDDIQIDNIDLLNDLQVIEVLTSANSEDALNDFTIIHMALDFGAGATMTISTQEHPYCALTALNRKQGE